LFAEENLSKVVGANSS